MFERLLFLLINSFLRAVQKHERARFIVMLEQRIETADEETRDVLGDLIIEVNNLEYIYRDSHKNNSDG
jgi:hypothetical protein